MNMDARAEVEADYRADLLLRADIREEINREYRESGVLIPWRVLLSVVAISGILAVWWPT